MRVGRSHLPKIKAVNYELLSKKKKKTTPPAVYFHDSTEKSWQWLYPRKKLHTPTQIGSTW